jgi:EAL domain-containing protein (putative c-di-GMP-specific phosphodiesterase class I)
MYAAKRANSGHTFYDEEVDVHDRGRLELVGELRRAIEERELVLHFQPKARLATGAVCSVEALLRWQHPERGLVFPADFLPLAQETSLMTPLTLYVIEEALAPCHGWQARGVTLSVAVNLARRNLLDASFPARVGELLERSGLDPGLLELEITESAMLGEQARVDEVLGRLAALGVRLSIDDFGTGYSSLSHLTRLPIGEIKIDRSFVGTMTHDRNAAVIVRSVVELAKSLRLDVVAEGVETRDVWRRLRRLGCTLAQGEFLSPPLPADALLHWIGDHGMMAAA